MPNRPRRAPRIVVPRPDRIRTLDHVAFGWIDARIHHDGWLRVLTPQALAVYTFLCLAADRRGISFYRRDRLARELGLDDVDVSAALTRLRDLDLVGYAPFRAGTADGFHQVLSVPPDGPDSAFPDESLLPLRDLIQETRIS